jgi:4-amino-4-deoxy-L-arabinose transferase-like glycosyltransferase
MSLSPPAAGHDPTPPGVTIEKDHGAFRSVTSLGRILPLVIVILTGLAVFFYRLGALPIYVWDEARVAVNALEMLESGRLLVTTYDGVPDLWNTKPPFAIWAEVASMRLFGVTEFALRLPSAAAALLTCLIAYAFTASVTKSRVAGLIAALVLMSCPGYAGIHVARTADYDALLTLFTTATALALWRAVERNGPPSATWMLLTGVAIALAILTKGVAGLLVLPGLAIYVIATGRALPLIRSPVAWIAALIAVGVPSVFYGLREVADPGYLKAVAQNELGARFTQTIAGGRSRPWFYYLLNMALPPLLPLSASAFPWSLAVPFAAWSALGSQERRTRSAALMCAVAGGTFLIVISAAATRVAWYAAPLFPFIAVLIGMAAHRVGLEGPGLARGVRAAGALAAAMVLLASLLSVSTRNDALARLAMKDPDTRTAAFARIILTAVNNGPIVIIRDGHGVLNGRPYTGPEDFYAKVAQRSGRDVRVESGSYTPAAGDTLLWCARDLRRPFFQPVGKLIQVQGDCRAIIVPPSQSLAAVATGAGVSEASRS